MSRLKFIASSTILAAFALITAFVSVQSVQAEPVVNTRYSFQAYAADGVYRGPVVYPDFNGRDRKYASFRTRIRDGIRSGENFAGHYAIITFGCGSGCLDGYVVDVTTGRVYPLPIGGEDANGMRVDYRPNSKLLVARFFGESVQRCLDVMYVWIGTSFELLGKKDVGDQEACWKEWPSTTLASSVRSRDSNGVRGCFVRVYDKAHLAQHPDQIVTAINLKIYHGQSNSANDLFSIRIQKRGEVKALHNGGYCETDGAEARCYVECDGGGFGIVPRSGSSVLIRLGIQPPHGPNGEVIKQDERIRMTPCGQAENDNDADTEVQGGKDDHQFLLFRAGDAECLDIDK